MLADTKTSSRVTSRTAAALGISRPTVESHLQALEITHAITLVRPFHGSGQKELVKMPKVYGCGRRNEVMPSNASGRRG